MNRPTPPHSSLPESLRRLTSVAGKGSLILMPDLWGSTIYGRPFVAELARDCSAYAVQLSPSNIALLSELSVEELGRQFAEVIDAAQLHRPVQIVGFSFAGLLAHETARQLALMGAAPDMVWILDLQRYRPLSPREFLRRPVHHAINIARHAKYNWRRWLLGRQEPDMLAAYGAVKLDLTKLPESYREIVRCNYAKMLLYRPPPTTVPTTLLRATQGFRYGEEDMGWGELVLAPFRVIDVPGTHTSMVQEPENAKVIAQLIRACLSSGDPAGEGGGHADIEH